MARAITEAEFWAAAKVVKRGCYEWQRSLTRPNGYGRVRRNGQNILTHRLAWVLSRKRDIPEGMRVLHTCDNPRCVKPEHLFLGTQSDNIADRHAKGRDKTGPEGPHRITAAAAHRRALLGWETRRAQ